MYVEALNQALRGIPTEKVRFHTCYSINEGPRVFDVPLADVVDLVLPSTPATTPSRPATRATSPSTTSGRRPRCPRTRC